MSDRVFPFPREVSLKKPLGLALVAMAAMSLPSASQATLVPRTVFAEEFGWVT